MDVNTDQVIFLPIGVLNTFTELQHSKVKYKFVFYQVSSPPSPSSLLKLPVLKTGVNMKTVFWLGITDLMQISRLRFKKSQESLCSSHISMFWAVLLIFY